MMKLLSSIIVFFSILLNSNAFASFDEARCMQVLYGNALNVPNLTSLSYDTQFGLTLVVAKGWYSNPNRKFVVPLLQNNKPNPSFDRLYALLMKSTDVKQPFYICTVETLLPFKESGEVTPQEIREVSVILSAVNDGSPKKVQVCDSTGSCAHIYGNALSTRPSN
jgi:hypothetical protein